MVLQHYTGFLVACQASQWKKGSLATVCPLYPARFRVANVAVVAVVAIAPADVSCDTLPSLGRPFEFLYSAL